MKELHGVMPDLGLQLQIASERRLHDAFLRMPKEIWALPLEWNRGLAWDFYCCIHPVAVPRTLRAEQRTARDLASTLRRASRDLSSHKRLDFYLAGVLTLASKFGMSELSRRIPGVQASSTPVGLGPRVSELLRAVAAMLEGSRHAVLFDLHGNAARMRVRQPGRYRNSRDLTAAEAALRLMEFFATYTGSPRSALTQLVVETCHGPSSVDFQVLARQRRRTKRKAGRLRKK